MDNPRLIYLFQRYTDRTCTEAERQELMQLIMRSSNDGQLGMLMEQLWGETPAGRHSLAPGKAEDILYTILAAEKKVIPVQRKKTMAFGWYAVAAAVAVLAVSAFIFYSIRHTETPFGMAAGLAERPADEHQFVKLPDGSTVILNGHSTLEYPHTFDGRTTREVTLNGEGFFDIRHDPARPFIVHTGSLKTTVLGTAFNIKAYDAEKSIVITVKRGKVSVSDDKEFFGVITPDQQIVFDKERKHTEQKQVDSRETTAWLERDIFFDDVTFAEAAGQLEERFAIQIRFNNAGLKACRFTATFVKGEDVEQILRVICEFNGTRYSRRDDGTVLIEGKGC